MSEIEKKANYLKTTTTRHRAGNVCLFFCSYAPLWNAPQPIGAAQSGQHPTWTNQSAPLRSGGILLSAGDVYELRRIMQV